MPYQLPQELQTNKLKSLPDDLREIAEAALAEKFDIPEIVKPKKAKKKAEPKVSSVPPPRDWDDRFEYVEIVIQTDEREVVAQPMAWSTQGVGSLAALQQMQQQVNTRYRSMHYQMMVDQHVPHYEIVRMIEHNIRRYIDEIRYRGFRTQEIQLWHRGIRMPINNIRDIEEFVQRSRVGGYGRY